MTEEDGVQAALRANAAFYDALARGHHDQMAGLWATTTPVSCIHPGGPPIRGLAPILESWRHIFKNPPEIHFSDAEVQMIRGLAVVTCFEHIEETRLAATNLFVWEKGQWAIACHQSGPVQSSQTAFSHSTGPLH